MKAKALLIGAVAAGALLAGCSASSSATTDPPAVPAATKAAAPAATTAAPAPTKAAPSPTKAATTGKVDGDWSLGKSTANDSSGVTMGTLRVTNITGDVRTAIFTVSVMVNGDVKGTLQGTANTVAPGKTVTVTLVGMDKLPKSYTLEPQVDTSF